MKSRTIRAGVVGAAAFLAAVLTSVSGPATGASDPDRRHATVTPVAPAVPSEGAGTIAPPGAGIRPLSRRNLSPMHREIFDALDREKARVEELNARVKSGVSPAEALALQQEIEEIKMAGQMTVLEIQVRYALQEGRVAQAEALERSLEILRNPPSTEDLLKARPRP